MSIVIITGARILADDPRSVAWAREILSRELASASLVVAGDARGPDAWAHEIALARRPLLADCWRWCVSGAVEVYGRVAGRWLREHPWGTPETTTDPRRRPLVRNAAMVEHYAHMGARLVALHHAAATTRDTAHTVGLARAAGIEVTEHVWRAP